MLLFWILFNLFVIAMLALDLGVLNRRAHTPRLPEALGWSAAWIGLAGAFAVAVFFWHGRVEALQFVTGYVIEITLSVDNLFIFLVIFRYFKVPGEHQHKVLFWGILGALVMRGVFIAAGVSLIRRFDWIVYAFGALLIYSGLKLLRQGDQQINPENNPVLRLVRRVLPITDQYEGGRFFTLRLGGGLTGKHALYATPLFVVLLVVETSDILVAADSIPAVLAVTLNAFVVYTSNVFAILGLRSMYFVLAEMMDRFHYLHYGLSAVLVLIGLKMIGSHYVNVPTEWTLGIVLAVLGGSIAASLARPPMRGNSREG
ncbi:MAG: TerC family protein [Terriglobales bacterium]